MLSWMFNSWNNEITSKYKSKITKNENGENVPEVVLINCSVVNNSSKKVQ